MKLTLVLCILLFGCVARVKEPESPVEKFKVEFLFEYEGCKVYRFHDGNKQSFAKCECAGN